MKSPTLSRAEISTICGKSWATLLLQVVFHARMAQEQGAFEFGDVVQTLIEKLVRRHPHVFGDARGLTAEAVEGLWERIKAEERSQKANDLSGEEGAGALAGVPVALPALSRALKLQAKAGNVGFDTLVGAIPFVGDLFDFGWKANEWNLALVELHAYEERHAAAGDWVFVIGMMVLVMAIAVLPFLLAGMLIAWLGARLF